MSCNIEEEVVLSEVIQPNHRGMAKIKSEYLLHDHVRSVNLEYVSKEDHHKIIEQSTEDGNQPPRKKLRGQNKHRPQEMRKFINERLCPSIIREESCPFGDECRFIHDVSTFLSNAMPNIGSKCHMFSEFGRCPSGITCRFSSAHLTSDFKNVVNEELWSQYKQYKTTRNLLSREIQLLLRKRKYNFDMADSVLKALPKFMAFKIGKAGSGIKSPSTAVSKTVAISPLDCPKIDTDSNLGVINISDELKEDEFHCCNDVRCYLGHEIDTSFSSNLKSSGAITDEDVIKTRMVEFRQVDFSGKLYLAPLTTVGNLPFRRICKRFGADITCGEMAMAVNLLQGQQSEWALLKRHQSEDIFGVQLCGAYADQMTRTSQLLMDNIDVDFIDINVGCPIDLVYHKGSGCGLMGKLRKFEEIVYGMRSVMNVPLTAKIRTGIYENKCTAHTLVPKLRDWGVSMTAMHGRSREQRYTKSADWKYVYECAKLATPMPMFGCGDILSYEEANEHLQEGSVTGIMIARGALIKPWIFTEIKEHRHWDISSGERFQILQDFVDFGLEHWGSDTEGVEKTRKFLLEWLSFLYRYIPVGLLEHIPQKINERPPYYRGRDDLETLMASPSCADWIKISEKLLGPVPSGFSFLPKHKANAYI